MHGDQDDYTLDVSIQVISQKKKLRLVYQIDHEGVILNNTGKPQLDLILEIAKDKCLERTDSFPILNSLKNNGMIFTVKKITPMDNTIRYLPTQYWIGEL